MAASASVAAARRLVEEGNFTEAVEILETHLVGSGDDRLARSLLANAHFKNGSYVAAEAQYHILVAMPNPNPRDLYSLGATLEKQRKYDQAMYWYAQAEKADPTLTQARAARERVGRAQASVGEPGAATNPSAKPPSGEAGTYVPTELGIPMTPEELAAYEQWKREKERSDWWTENWYRLPVPMRIAKVLGLLVVLAIGVAVAYGIYNVLTSDGTPGGEGGTTVTITTEPPDGTTTVTVTETTTITETTDTEPPIEGDPVAGRDVFISAGQCGDCHTLADAGTTGTVGPNLDEAQPSEALVVERVTNGQGAMPSYEGKLTEQQIADVAAYVVDVTSGS